MHLSTIRILRNALLTGAVDTEPIIKRLYDVGCVSERTGDVLH